MSFRSEVFKRAHELKNVYRSFSLALKRSWELYRFYRPKKVVKRGATPEQLQKLARNINAFDVNYHYIDDGRKWDFWYKLNDKLRKYLKQLTKEAKAELKLLCKPEQAEYFSL